VSNSLDRLIYMANQIARNLATNADPVRATADHIASFWDPRMKAMIFGHLAGGGEGLDPPARAALDLLADGGAPASQTEATRFNRVDEGGGSDAG
jgi:formate dehydrogenase subunit delta